MDDADIIRKLRNGEEDVFPILVERYQNLVLNCCFKFLRNRESAEDVTQEVFLEIYQSGRQFRGEARLSTWIYRIAVTRSLNQLKSLNRRKRLAAVVGLFDDERSEDHAAAEESVNPQNMLENRERAAVLAWALGKLPANQKIAFTLSKCDGMKYEEIASILNATIPSVESLLHRARTNLRKRLSRYYREQL